MGNCICSKMAKKSKLPLSPKVLRRKDSDTPIHRINAFGADRTVRWSSVD